MEPKYLACSTFSECTALFLKMNNINLLKNTKENPLMKKLSQTCLRCGTSDKAQANFAIIFAESLLDRRAITCQCKGNGGISSELYRKGWLPLTGSAFVFYYQLCVYYNEVSGFSHF